MSKNNSGAELKEGHNALLMGPALRQHTGLCSKLNGSSQLLPLGPRWLLPEPQAITHLINMTDSCWGWCQSDSGGGAVGEVYIDRSYNFTDKFPDLKYILNMLHLSLMCVILI